MSESESEDILNAAILQRVRQLQRGRGTAMVLGLAAPGGIKALKLNQDDLRRADHEIASVIREAVARFFEPEPAPAVCCAPEPATVQKAFYCERLHQCKWQCFALHQGLGWGAIPPETDPWMIWHKRECGGKLVPLYGAAGEKEGV